MITFFFCAHPHDADCAQIVELARRVVVASDLYGQRALRYYVHQGAFYLLSHDLPFVATGE